MNKSYREYKLNNGLVVALQDTQTNTIAGELEVHFGVINERKEEKGLVHFLEHCLATSGSKKYSPQKVDEFRGGLGFYNALTDIGGTYFVSEMLPEDIEQWLDFISDCVFNPGFDTKRVEGERQRVLREMEDERSDPPSEANIAFKKAFYGTHPISLSTIGNEALIKKADIDKLKKVHSRGYHPNNMDLILVGSLPENIEDLIENYFGKQKSGKSTRIKFPRLGLLKKRTIIHTSAPYLCDEENLEESSANIQLAFVTVPEIHPDSVALSIISYVLGEGSANSRFFKTLSLEKGLAYSVSSSYGSSYNAGSFEISGMVSAKRLEEAINCIFIEMQKIRREGITKKELEQCKKRAKFELAKTYDTNEGGVVIIEKRLDTGWTPESFISRFDTITLKEIKEVANKYLPESRKTGKYVLSMEDPLKE